MFYAGRKVLQLFTLTLPLYLLLHCGPFLSRVFSPHTLWIPTSLLLLLHCILSRRLPSSEKRAQKSCGLWDTSVCGAVKRISLVFLPPCALTALTYWIMVWGCLPCSTNPSFESRSSPSKPLLVGHRGCAFDYPENSLVAYEGAAALPAVVGLETDIFISMDGVPYLIHDPNLVRTTDVTSKCPSHNPLSNSTLLHYHNGSCPLSKLNIGRSFLKFRGDGLSPQEKTSYASQKIPTFRQFLEIAKRTGEVVMFDVSRPPVGHPYHHTYLNRTLQEIAASGLPHSKVQWNLSLANPRPC